MREWKDPHHENTMYSDSQVKALWDESIYNSCPLFLDYPVDECPSTEKIKFNKAMEKRKERVAKEVLL